MSCKVEGCNRLVYHYNPLVMPLLNFHGTIVTLGSRLQEDENVLEVVKRMGYAVVAPFAYLALAFVALAGLILDEIWEKRHVLQIKAANRAGSVPHKEAIAEETAVEKGCKISKEALNITDCEITFSEAAEVPSKEGILLGEASLKLESIKETEIEMSCQVPEGAFGKAEWEKAFPVTIKDVPPLPPNINQILEQEDPCEPGKKLKDTCMLFLRPRKVIFHKEGFEKKLLFGFDGVEKVAKKAINQNRRTKFKAFHALRIQMSEMPAPESCWVLMRKEVIPGTRGESFEIQKSLLKGGFVVPKMMDAVLLNILNFASEGKYLFGKKPWTYTLCQENHSGRELIVGGFGPSGLHVDMIRFDPDHYGLAGVWEFKAGNLAGSGLLKIKTITEDTKIEGPIHSSQGAKSKKESKISITSPIEELCQIPQGAFGKAEWEKTFPVTIKDAPPLPSNIDELLEQEDPCEPGKKLKETCMLFMRPKKVILYSESGEKELHLGFEGVEKLAKKTINPDRKSKYWTFDKLRSKMNWMPAADAGWVLMRKELIPGSRNKSFEAQKQLLKGSFMVPKLMDAVLLNILTYAREGNCLYNGEKPGTYTRCEEKYKSYQSVVGGFDPSKGINICNPNFDYEEFGLSGVWNFQGKA